MRLPIALLFLASAVYADVHVPTGHRADVFARGLENATTLLALEDGTVLVARPQLNDVIALRDTDNDGRADRITTALSSIEHAHGLAMRGRTLYVAGVKKIVAADRRADGTFGEPREIVGDLPDGGLHPQRALGFGPDGKLYVAIGSSCGNCKETNPEHATLLQMNADGGNRRVFARGLRSVGGFDWNPASGELWSVHDGVLHRIGDGLDYSTAAGVELPSKAPVGLVFSKKDGDAFTVWRDSAKVARIRFEDGKPSAPEDLATGGKFAGIAVAADGALLVSDDENGIIYRVVKGDPAPMTSSVAELPPMPVLRKEFHTAGLGRPDAVLHDEEQDVYFVSNRAGFVSKLTPDGRIATLRFIDELEAPKGIAVRGRELWVADGTRLHAFDRVSGERITEMFVDGAVVLSDIAVGPDESLYVTDTGVRVKESGERERVREGRIYRVLGKGKIEVVLEGEELRAPNGIAWDGTRFLIAQSYGRELLAWQPGGSRIKAVVRGPGAYNGVVVLPNGAVLVSSHHDDAIHVARGGELVPLFTRRPTPGDIAFDRKRNRLLVPSLDGNWLEAWTLPPMENRNAARDEDDEPELARK